MKFLTYSKPTHNSYKKKSSDYIFKNFKFKKNIIKNILIKSIKFWRSNLFVRRIAITPDEESKNRKEKTKHYDQWIDKKNYRLKDYVLQEEHTYLVCSKNRYNTLWTIKLQKGKKTLKSVIRTNKITDSKITY